MADCVLLKKETTKSRGRFSKDRDGCQRGEIKGETMYFIVLCVLMFIFWD